MLPLTRTAVSQSLRRVAPLSAQPRRLAAVSSASATRAAVPLAVRTFASSCPSNGASESSSTAATAAAASTPSAAASASAAAPSSILVERRPNGVAIVRFNRPAVYNAMTVDMGEEFLRVVGGLAKCPALRCVVLTGEGKAFSAGGDLDFLLARCDDAPANNSPMMRAFYARFLSLLSLPVPIIAAINGPAIGAGACVATACDYRVMAKDVDIGFTFSKMGLHPGMGATHFLPIVVGQQQAARLLLTGEVIKGSRALEIGLVGQVVEQPSDVLQAALQLADDIAAQPPVGVRTLTTSLRMRVMEGMERALTREADSQAQSYATKELREHVQALKTKTHKKKQ